MVMESQTELLSPALAVGTLQLCSREVVQFHFLHQERARHDGTVGFSSSQTKRKKTQTLSVCLQPSLEVDQKKHNQWAEVLRTRSR